MSLDTIRHVYELVRITHKLYPKQTVTYCFDRQIEVLKNRFTASEIKLIKELVTALTLLNQKDRICNQKEVLSTMADFKNAVYLVTPSEMRLKAKSYELLYTLYRFFGLESFTYFDVEIKLCCSNSKVKRILKPLFYHELLIIHDRNDKAAFRRLQIFINPEAFELYQRPIVEEQGSFDIMNEDWEGFEGFNDCRMRT